MSRKAATPAMSLPAILCECQQSASPQFQLRFVRMLATRRREAPTELLEELLSLLLHAFVVAKARCRVRGCAARGLTRARAAAPTPARSARRR